MPHLFFRATAKNGPAEDEDDRRRPSHLHERKRRTRKPRHAEKRLGQQYSAPRERPMWHCHAATRGTVELTHDRSVRGRGAADGSLMERYTPDAAPGYTTGKSQR